MTAVGWNALVAATGETNTALGSTAGNSITTGSDNTCLGYNADVSAVSAVYQTVVGSDAVGTADNQVTLGRLGTDWTMETGGATLNADFTSTSDVMANTALSQTVVAGRSYEVRACLQISNTTATDGIKFDFAGGTATATTFFAGVTFIGSVTAGTVASVALATDLTATVVTGTDYAVVTGYLKVNAGGTFILEAAEQTDAGGTLTIGAGSWMRLKELGAPV